MVSDYGSYAEIGDLVRCINPKGDQYALGVLIAYEPRKSMGGTPWRLLHILEDSGDVVEIKEAFVRLVEPREIEEEGPFPHPQVTV